MQYFTQKPHFWQTFCFGFIYIGSSATLRKLSTEFFSDILNKNFVKLTLLPLNHRASWFHEIFYKWEKICDFFPHCECAWINVSYVTYLMLKMRVNFRNFHTVILKYRKCLGAMCKILKFTYSYKSAPFMNSMILLLFNWYQYKFNPFCWYTSVLFSMLSYVSVSVSMCVSARACSSLNLTKISWK